MPQFTEVIDIITLKIVIFPMRFCVDIKKLIASSSNNIILHSNTPFYSANNGESNGVLDDTIAYSFIFI